MPVREASVVDFNPILDMCEEFWQHTQFVEAYDRGHTQEMVRMSYDQGLLAVVDDFKKGLGVYGFIAAIKTPLLASRQAWMATELAWWVDPMHRGTLGGVNLLKFLEGLCISQDVKYLNMAFMETSMPEKVRLMYEKLGYSQQEAVFTKVLIDGCDNNWRCAGRGRTIRGG